MKILSIQQFSNAPSKTVQVLPPNWSESFDMTVTKQALVDVAKNSKHLNLPVTVFDNNFMRLVFQAHPDKSYEMSILCELDDSKCMEVCRIKGGQQKVFKTDFVDEFALANWQDLAVSCCRPNVHNLVLAQRLPNLNVGDCTSPNFLRSLLAVESELRHLMPTKLLQQIKLADTTEQKQAPQAVQNIVTVASHPITVKQFCENKLISHFVSHIISVMTTEKHDDVKSNVKLARCMAYNIASVVQTDSCQNKLIFADTLESFDCSPQIISQLQGMMTGKQKKMRFRSEDEKDMLLNFNFVSDACLQSLDLGLKLSGNNFALVCTWPEKNPTSAFLIGQFCEKTLGNGPLRPAFQQRAKENKMSKMLSVIKNVRRNYPEHLAQTVQALSCHISTVWPDTTAVSPIMMP